MPEHPLEYADESNGEANLLSFVVHIWQEDSAPEKQQPIWRGHITPVPNGRRIYFADVNQIPDLIVAYVKLEKKV